MRLVDASTAPQVDAGCQLLVRCYALLSSTKQIGMAVGPIPVTAIWQWCDRRGISRETALHVERVIKTVDDRLMSKERAAAKQPDRGGR